MLFARTLGGGLLVVVFGVIALWTHASSPLLVPVRDVTDVPGQLAFVLHHPLAYATTLVDALWVDGRALVHSAIGVPGWLNVPMPTVAYQPAGLRFILAIAADPRAAIPRGRWWDAWDTLLLAAVSCAVSPLYLGEVWCALARWAVSGIIVAGLAMTIWTAPSAAPSSRRRWSG